MTLPASISDSGAPECAYCGESGIDLRVWGAPADDRKAGQTLICEKCFTPRDDGPCFDDLPEVRK